MTTTARNEPGGGFTLTTVFPQVDSIGDGLIYVFDHADLATDVEVVRQVSTNEAEAYFNAGYLRPYSYTVTAYYRRSNDGEIVQTRPPDTGSGVTVEEPAGLDDGELVLDVIATGDGFPGLQLKQPPYDLEVNSLSEIRQTFRRRQVTNPHVEGTYTINAERENVEVPVNVWCDGPTARETRQQLRQLEMLFSSRVFFLQIFFGDSDYEEWTCEVSDYTIEQTRDWRFARIGLIKANAVVRKRRVVQL